MKSQYVLFISLILFYISIFTNCKQIGRFKHYCLHRSTICPLHYRPVCAWYDDIERCVRSQCSFTASNPCLACRNHSVKFWTDGRCPN